MTIDDTLARFTAGIDADEQVAREAIRPDRPGTHWHWVTDATDTPVNPGDEAEAIRRERISLRTVEEFPTSSVGPLPAFVIYLDYLEHPQGARHIAHFDPAKMQRYVAALRTVVREILEYESALDGEFGCGHTAKQIAAGECPDVNRKGIAALTALASIYSEDESA